MLRKGRRHLGRYSEIAGVFARHGWGWMLDRIGLGEHLKAKPGAKPAQIAPAHIREILEELGPTFVKLGQLLSIRPDVLPQPYIEEFSKLQDAAPALPVDVVRAVIESELEAPVGDLFQEFDDVPLAAASLAQVHGAVMHDGTPVIVKVQRPGIRDQVETDIEILYKRARFLEGHWEKARTYGFTDIVDEFALTIREELDFTCEARNTDRLREVTAGDKGIRVPQVYWDLTTGKVLTLEMMRGTRITDILQRPPGNINRKHLAATLAGSFFEQVFVDGFFHADPHPGNVLVTDSGEIQLVDCGQVGRLDAETRAGAVRLLMAFEQQDTRAFADEVLDMGIAQEDVDIRRLTRDVGKVLRTYYDMPSRSINFGVMLTRILDVSAEHKIRLPASFAVLGKVFANVDATCSRLDPDFNFTEIARGYVGKAVKKEFSSESTLAELYRTLAGLRHFLLGLPEHLDRLVRKAVEGTLRIEFKHHGLEEMSGNFRSSANRVAIALIVGATIIGSSLVATLSKGPTSWFGLPTLGIIGYLVAMFFGAWLIISIIRSGRH